MTEGDCMTNEGEGVINWGAGRGGEGMIKEDK